MAAGNTFMRRSAGAVGAVLARAAPASADPVSGDPRAERHRLFRAVRELTGALGPSTAAWTSCGTRGCGRGAVSWAPRRSRATSRWAVPIGDAALAQCRGRLAEHRGDLAGAVSWYRSAAAAHETLPAPYFAAVVAERKVACLLSGDPPAATARLSTLVDTFDGLGATQDAARCRHLLRGTGNAKPSRRGRRGYGNELSPREVDVARLLAAGHTNREIAEILSPRTVEQHAARVLRKLGVSSRNDLR